MTYALSQLRCPHAWQQIRTSCVIGLLGIILLLMFLTFVRVNVSTSAPVGFYHRHPVTTLAYGTLVSVPVPTAWQVTALGMGIIPNVRTPLLKPIAGLPWDEVCITDHELWVHGLSYGPIVEGFPPAFEGCVTVKPGEVFLASHVPRSFDSRYWGTVPTHALQARLTPLWTW
jgi:conjugative transfer signal peptidase TraF